MRWPVSLEYAAPCICSSGLLRCCHSDIAGNAKESGYRGDEAEVLATSEGTGDDAVNSRLYYIIEACVHSLQAAAEQWRLKFLQKSTPPPKVAENRWKIFFRPSVANNQEQTDENGAIEGCLINKN
jgi:hypothetical protein